MAIRSAVIGAALLLACAPCGASGDAVLALQRIKAAFLYKFAAYVEWPPQAFEQVESPIVIGVAGADGIARELEEAVAGRKVGARAVEVRRVAGRKPADCCHILFVGGKDRERTSSLLASVNGKPVLTVTDAAGDHPPGSVINFLEADDRVRFDISRGAAERNGLQLRSQLLGVARQVASP